MYSCNIMTGNMEQMLTSCLIVPRTEKRRRYHAFSPFRIFKPTDQVHKINECNKYLENQAIVGIR